VEGREKINRGEMEKLVCLTKQKDVLRIKLPLSLYRVLTKIDSKHQL
jgi:hypothetical protein